MIITQIIHDTIYNTFICRDIYIGEIIGVITSFWGGMGIGIVVVSAIRLVQIVRFKNNVEYAKKLTVNNDERNHFLATKALSSAFYYLILIDLPSVFFIIIAPLFFFKNKYFFNCLIK